MRLEWQIELPKQIGLKVTHMGYSIHFSQEDGNWLLFHANGGINLP